MELGAEDRGLPLGAEQTGRLFATVLLVALSVGGDDGTSFTAADVLDNAMIHAVMRLRYLAVAIAFIGCKSATDSASAHGSIAIAPPVGSDADTASGRLGLPEVSAADAVVTPSGPTPLLVVVDKSGKLAFGVGSVWNALASYDPATSVRDENLDHASKLLSEARKRHMTPAQVVASLRDDARGDATPPATLSADERGERGDGDHALALDVGKMGKGSPSKPRTEHDNNVDTAGGFGEVPSLGDPGELDLRRASVAGEVVGKLAPAQLAVVLADPHANASAMISAVTMSRGVIGVSHVGAVAALRIQFLDARASGPNEHWADLRVGAKLEFRPQDGGKTITLADNASLETAYKAAHLDPYRVVDVLVAPDIDAQHLVDILVSLEHAGARAIGLGELPPLKK